MFVSGDPLRSPGPRGEQLHDRSFMIWLNAAAEPVTIALPVNDWVQTGEVVLSTAADLPPGAPIKAGDRITMDGRSVLVLRQT
jgi:glycogen operon protein